MQAKNNAAQQKKRLLHLFPAKLLSITITVEIEIMQQPFILNEIIQFFIVSIRLILL